MINVKQKVVSGLFWTGSANIVEQGITWIISILLARLLMPSDYGLMALANMFIYSVGILSELSIGAAIVRKREIDESYLSSSFWFMAFLSIMVYAIMYYLVAPIAGSFFNQGKLVQMIRVLGIIFIILGITVIPQSLIARNLEYGKRAKALFVSRLIMGLVSLQLAYLGFGVWSLVFGALVKEFSFSVLCYYYHPWKPTWTFSLSKIHDLLSFAIPLTGSKIFGDVYKQSDNFIIGKILGDGVLGFYHMAFRLSALPVDRLAIVIDQVNFPIFSRIQDSDTRSKSLFLKTSKYVSLIMLPALVGMALTADDLVEVLLGQKWISIVLPLRILCGVGIFRSLNSIIYSLLVGRGRADVIFKFTLLSSISLPSAFLIGSQIGLAGVALAWVAVFPFLFAYMLKFGLKELNLSLREYLTNLFPIIKATLFMLITVFIFRNIGIDQKVLRLIGSVAIGFLSYMAFFAMLNREIIGEIKTTIYSLKAKRSQA